MTVSRMILVVQMQTVAVVIKTPHYHFMMVGLIQTKRMVNVNYLYNSKSKCMILLIATTKYFNVVSD